MIKDMFYVKPGTPAQQADLNMFFTMMKDKHTKVSARYGMRDYCRIILEKQGLFLTVIVEGTDDIISFINKLPQGNGAERVTIINEKTGKRADVSTPVSSDNFV